MRPSLVFGLGNVSAAPLLVGSWLLGGRLFRGSLLGSRLLGGRSLLCCRGLLRRARLGCHIWLPIDFEADGTPVIRWVDSWSPKEWKSIR